MANRKINKVDVANTLHCAAESNILTTAYEIFDENLQQRQQDINNVTMSISAEINGADTANLWAVTTQNGYLSDKGKATERDGYNSGLLTLEAGETYNVTQQKATNNVRVFSTETKEIVPVDLWGITTEGGYLNANGKATTRAEFNSCLLTLEAGETYNIVQNKSTNNVRIYQYSDSTYTQVQILTGATVDYTCPNDGNVYVMQVVQDTSVSGVPEIYKQIAQKSETVYTQVFAKTGATVSYTCPNDGNVYVMQVVQDTSVSGVPEVHKAAEIGIKNRLNEVESRTKSISTIEKDVNSLNTMIAGTVSGNIYKETITGGYLSASGVETARDDYNSCQITMTADVVYNITQQKRAAGTNNIRIFTLSSGKYSQIIASSADEYSYKCPDDGKTYVLQVVRNNTEEGTPTVYAEKVGFSKTINSNTEAIDTLAKRVNSLSESGAEREINILFIGNSYARDGFSYMPRLMEDICGIKVNCGIFYKGSCTLKTHYQLFSTNGTYEAFDFYDSEVGSWVSTSNPTVNDYINHKRWDIVMLQEQSAASRDYEKNYQPYLNDLINLLFTKVNSSFKIGFVLTPSYPDSYSGLGGSTSEQMFLDTSAAVQRVLKETCVEFIIPIGTSVQNARTTSLSTLGNFGGLSYEGKHLQEGIPCLLEAYTATLCIMSLCGYGDKGIYGNKIRPTQTWVEALNVPQRHGNSVGVTDANCLLAQKCATFAIKNPYTVTDMSTM